MSCPTMFHPISEGYEFRVAELIDRARESPLVIDSCSAASANNRQIRQQSCRNAKRFRNLFFAANSNWQLPPEWIAIILSGLASVRWVPASKNNEFRRKRHHAPAEEQPCLVSISMDGICPSRRRATRRCFGSFASNCR